MTLIVSAAVILSVKPVISNIESGLQHLVELPVTGVNLDNIEDGSYYGRYSTFPVSVEVKVTVTDHVITAIELIEHRHGQGKAAEVITGKVVEAQNLAVDLISGATYSSKVIIKAIEDALVNAVQ